MATRFGRVGIGQGFTLPRARRDWLALLAIGVIGGGIPFLLFFEGLARTTSTDAAFIQKTMVVWVAVLAVSFLRERFTFAHVGAIALLVSGQVALTTGLAAPSFDTGEAMILAATLLWSVEIVIAKPVLARLSPLTVGAARMGVGVFVLLGFAVASGSLANLASVTGTAWLWTVATGVILTAYVATWYAALSRAGAIDVTAVLVFAAVITAALNAGVKHVNLAPSATGLVLVSAGALAVALLSLRPKVRA
jgi:drug/metabolite transporter (DMT)-like permease